jgi:hypothetical protein
MRAVSELPSPQLRMQLNFYQDKMESNNLASQPWPCGKLSLGSGVQTVGLSRIIRSSIDRAISCIEPPRDRAGQTLVKLSTT